MHNFLWCLIHVLALHFKLSKKASLFARNPFAFQVQVFLHIALVLLHFHKALLNVATTSLHIILINSSIIHGGRIARFHPLAYDSFDIRACLSRIGDWTRIGIGSRALAASSLAGKCRHELPFLDGYILEAYFLCFFLQAKLLFLQLYLFLDHLFFNNFLYRVEICRGWQLLHRIDFVEGTLESSDCRRPVMRELSSFEQVLMRVY